MVRIINHVSRDTLIKELINSKNNLEACKNLKLSLLLFNDLIKHYKIKEDEYRPDRTKKKWLQEYDTVIQILGRHPSTAELQKNPAWKGVYYAISRYWGNYDNFRKEFGIEKVGHFAHEETKRAWEEGVIKAREVRSQRKEERKNRILGLIKNRKTVGIKELKENLDVTGSCLSIYLHELEESNLIRKSGTGRQIKYIENVPLTN